MCQYCSNMIAVKTEVIYATFLLLRIKLTQDEVRVVLLAPLLLQKSLKIDRLQGRLCCSLLNHFFKLPLLHLFSILLQFC